MKCVNCGAEYSEQANFCRQCGVALNQNKNQTTQEETGEDRLKFDFDHAMRSAGEKLHVLKRLPKKAIAAMACGAAAVIIFGGTAYAKTTIVDLDRYIEINCSGYDGYGFATYDVDWNRLADDYKSLKFRDSASATRYCMENSPFPVDALKDMTEITVLNPEGISNGDQIEYTCNVSEQALSQILKCKVKASGGTEKAKGLSPVQEYDPFEYLDVSFTGADPGNGQLDITYFNGADQLDSSDFTAGQSDGLSNGDTVTVSLLLNPEDMAYYVSNTGMKPVVMEKEYEVSGIPTYTKNVDDIKGSGLNLLKAQAEEIIARGSNSDHISSQRCIGFYLEKAKDQKENLIKNRGGLVYKIDYKFNSTIITAYYDVRFLNMLTDENGFCEPERNEEGKYTYESAAHSFSQGWHYVYGYETLNELKTARESETAGEFDIVWNLGESKTTDTKENGSNTDDTEDISSALTASEGADGTSEYLCSFGSERLITNDDIADFLSADYRAEQFPADQNGKARDVIQMMINELLAKQGYEFKDAGLNTYFQKKSWYANTPEKTTDMKKAENRMSTTEYRNYQKLSKQRDGE